MSLSLRRLSLMEQGPSGEGQRGNSRDWMVGPANDGRYMHSDHTTAVTATLAMDSNRLSIIVWRQ